MDSMLRDGRYAGRVEDGGVVGEGLDLAVAMFEGGKVITDVLWD